jgi:RNA recognition motif-containing protein
MASVFVRGFDFGTTTALIEGHCSQAGSVNSIELFGRGSAVVTYSTPAQAKAAVKLLHGTTIGSNTRYIEVKINDESKSQGQKRSVGGTEDSCRVFARGFDFGTTDEQLEEHMGQAGTLEKVMWCTKGSAICIYSSPEEAETAVSNLNGSTIPGQSRYIDVILKDAEDQGPPAKRAKGASKGAAKGGWAFVPQPALPWMTMPVFPAQAKGWAKGAGKGGKPKEKDPAGSGRVFVRGFDFGTTDEMFESHMKQAGPVHKIHWVTKGSEVVVYKKAASAQKASVQLNGSTLAGNSRYIDVLLKESE